jgi:aryl-alcohol dehydrogenase-like predicted oxidoreductase
MQMNNTIPFSERVKAFHLQNSPDPIPYGMGCAYIGRTNNYRDHITEDMLTLETAYQHGFRYFDTAPYYHSSEWVVGEFVATIPRESIFLATKFNLPAFDNLHQAVSHTRASLDESLRRLKTDTLDLFQVHDVNSLANVLAEGGVLEVLLEAKRQGIVNYIGVATRWHNILTEAVLDGRFDTILTYSDFTPFNQSAGPLIEFARQHGYGVINASPLAGLREHGYSPSDRSSLAMALQFPLTNPHIDITLTGPSNSLEIRSSLEVLKNSSYLRSEQIDSFHGMT